MALTNDFLGAGLNESAGYTVAFNNAGGQVGSAEMTAINGLSINNGMDATIDPGFDAKGPGGMA